MRADVVQVAADVSGLVSEVLVHDNQAVKQGEVLFRIDPVRFQIVLRDAQAAVDNKLAVAQEAEREMARYNRLSALSVSEEQQQQRGAAAVEAQAAYQQALASRDVAALNLARSAVRASVNGFVRAENIRVVPVFGAAALAVSPRVGHLHVTVDNLPWDWADASGVPVIIQNLPPGPHRVLVEIADANHHILDHRLVEFSVPDVGQRSSTHAGTH